MADDARKLTIGEWVESAPDGVEVLSIDCGAGDSDAHEHYVTIKFGFWASSDKPEEVTVKL